MSGDWGKRFEKPRERGNPQRKHEIEKQLGFLRCVFVKQEGTNVKTIKSKTDINNNSPPVSNQEGTATESAARRSLNSRTFATISSSIKLADIHRQVRYKKCYVESGSFVGIAYRLHTSILQFQ
ncbi:hypothetical protein DPMN_027857 [Dreissena polymorpha]|uniref:Uncharacterized protein n=1 Tax=Dreissena polymorpha TaxID=45954 RepID=A0A9D4LVY5_DREPO|nr:hypothetical protein DPMN_027857 [Dreissena polymorpha]